ncbi:MAG TPA: YjjG family noncanonical pyrimidine nucleotidase [Spirochaetia bacterium]|nr:YjjG family noncanonical pyrimidine nucleotidase [Spirochaetia bacterium]
MKYEVVLFDADGTLMDFERAEREALRRTFEFVGIDYAEARHLPPYKSINRQIWLEFEEGAISSAKLGRERFVRYLTALDLDADPGKLSEAYVTYLAEGDFLIPGADEMLRALAGSCRMSVVTNGLSRVQNSRFSRSALSRYFDGIVISEEVGARKPEREIFDVALSAYPDVPLSKVLMVGDSLSSDIAGGITYGLATCWYNPEGVSAPIDALPAVGGPDYDIRELREIPPIVLGA